MIKAKKKTEIAEAVVTHLVPVARFRVAGSTKEAKERQGERRGEMGAERGDGGED